MSGLVERRCEHGVRWPHPCDDCHAEDCKPHNLIARITALEAENERMKLEVEKHEALHVSAYYAGMKAGWNFGVADDVEGYNRSIESTEHIAELRRIRAARQALGGPHDAD